MKSKSGKKKKDMSDGKPKAKTFTKAEVAAANKPDQLWLIINGKVYDCTEWQFQHPAGPSVILDVAGQDATSLFFQLHSPNAKKILADYYLGDLEADALMESVTMVNEFELEFKKFNVLESVSITPSVKCITFSYGPLRDGERELDPLICGGHFCVQVPTTSHEGGEQEYRNYSPIRWEYNTSTKTYIFDMMVKLYPHGLGSTYMHQLKPKKEEEGGGDSVIMRGPLRPFYIFPERREEVEVLVLIAGGTGITPIYSVIDYAIQNSSSGTGPKKIFVFGCFKNEAEMLMVDELVKLIERNDTNLMMERSKRKNTEEKSDRDAVGGCKVQFFLCLSQVKKGEALKGHYPFVFRGRISGDGMKQVGVPKPWQPGTEAVVCGPGPLNASVRHILFSEMRYPQTAMSVLESGRENKKKS